MIQDKCKGCKYYKEGLSCDYVRSCWCDLDNFDNDEICEHYNDPYTVLDFIDDCWLGILILIGIGFTALIMNLK